MLANGNSQATAFASLLPAARMLNADGSIPDGIQVWGHDGMNAPGRLALCPMAEGPAGTNFSIRVYGWRGLAVPSGDPNKVVAIPVFIAEFACTTGEISGPPQDGPTYPRNLSDTERLCDTITLVQGHIGTTGFINSAPGTNLIASVVMDIVGCRYFQIDFQGTDQNIGMNCLFARA